MPKVSFMYFFFFNDTATTEIYTLSLHDALPISRGRSRPLGHCAIRSPSCCSWNASPWPRGGGLLQPHGIEKQAQHGARDRKSTRLNSSHANISYAVFCLKKKKSLAASNKEKSRS